MSRAAAAVAALASATALAAGCRGGEPYVIEGCEPSANAPSVVRVWDEQILAAIRRDVPAPTVHARNLFHVSVAMWDAWAAYDPGAAGYVVREKRDAADVLAAREAAISYAAFRVLLHRYSLAAGLEETFTALAGTMESLCYRVDFAATEGDSPAALGNRIAAAVIERGKRDGANEELRYADTAYRPVNDPLIVSEPGAAMRDPGRWQPLALEKQETQNGLAVPAAVQRFIGSHWGGVTGFALPAAADGLPLDPGPPPAAGHRSLADAALEVVRLSSRLDPVDGVLVDIGPGARGANRLGANDGHGHRVDPTTGRPYEPNRVLRADWARAIAEFWADGPDSETPPGHWNTLANEVSDRVAPPGRAARLAWDVKVAFALNGALHDAAIAAWAAKASYDSARPISLVRYLGGRGELPLVPGLVERVTRASSAPGGRHEHLAAHVGELAVRSWRGTPADPGTERAGVGWIRAVEWLPYQRPTFVTPAFAGYVSGHSTFSRAAAEVLTAATGSPFFPGGAFEHVVAAGSFVHEAGPERDVVLRWATYADAADEAGISRLYGGIHIGADDLAGRKLGAVCGRQAWALAQRYFDGEVYR